MRHGLSVTYRTRITEVEAIELGGKLELRDLDPEDPDSPVIWQIHDGNKWHNLEAWLEKFDGDTVVFSIRRYFNEGDDKLLDGIEQYYDKEDNRF